MAKGEFDMLYLCAGRGGGGVELDSYWYFPLINQHLLRGVRKKPWDDQGRLPKNERQK